MNEYTKEENLANACLHICMIAQDCGLSKEDFIDAVSHSFDETEKIEDKEEFAQYLKERALRKVFGI